MMDERKRLLDMIRLDQMVKAFTPKGPYMSFAPYAGQYGERREQPMSSPYSGGPSGWDQGGGGEGTAAMGGEGISGPENGELSTQNLVKMMLSIPLQMNPFSPVIKGALSQFKGEHALNMNSVPQTGWNLLMNALGINAGMDPSSIPGMQAISQTHSINEAMAEIGMDPTGHLGGLGNSGSSVGMAAVGAPGGFAIGPLGGSMEGYGPSGPGPAGQSGYGDYGGEGGYGLF